MLDAVIGNKARILGIFSRHRRPDFQYYYGMWDPEISPAEQVGLMLCKG